MAGFVAKLPLKFDGIQGYAMITDLKNLVKQNFLMILLTNPGERIMNTNFGVGLKRILFENFSPQTISLFEQRLLDQTKIHMPYITIENIDYSRTQEDSSLLSVNIRIFILPLGISSNFIIQSNGEIINT